MFSKVLGVVLSFLGISAFAKMKGEIYSARCTA